MWKFFVVMALGFCFEWSVEAMIENIMNLIACNKEIKKYKNLVSGEIGVQNIKNVEIMT